MSWARRKRTTRSNKEPPKRLQTVLEHRESSTVTVQQKKKDLAIPTSVRIVSEYLGACLSTKQYIIPQLENEPSEKGSKFQAETHKRKQLEARTKRYPAFARILPEMGRLANGKEIPSENDVSAKENGIHAGKTVSSLDRDENGGKADEILSEIEIGGKEMEDARLNGSKEGEIGEKIESFDGPIINGGDHDKLLGPLSHLPQPKAPNGLEKSASNGEDKREMQRSLSAESSPAVDIASLGKFLRDRSTSLSASISKRISSLKESNGQDQKVTEIYLPGLQVTVQLKKDELDLKGRISFFSRSNCRDCTAVRSFFRERGLKFVEINIDVFPEREKELIQRSGSASVPQIFFNEKLLGGLVALNSLRNSGELEWRMKEMMGRRCPESAPSPPVYGFDEEAEERADEMVGIVRVLRQRLPIQDRLTKMKLVKNCFAGSEMVEVLIHHLDCGRKKVRNVTFSDISSRFFAFFSRIVFLSVRQHKMDYSWHGGLDRVSNYLFPGDTLAVVFSGVEFSTVGLDFYPPTSPTSLFRCVDAFDFFIMIFAFDLAFDLAVEIGKVLSRKRFIHHVFGENEFEDGTHFYRFLEHEPTIPRCYNFRGSTNDAEPKPAAVVGQKLTKIMSAILEAYGSNDRRHLDYKLISRSEEFRRYVNMAQDLQRVDVVSLSADEKLAFFLNLYNAMVIHAVIRSGPQEGVADQRMYGDFHYIVGGHPYSLNAIKNGILRCNRRQPYSLIRPFGSGDKRLEVALPKVNPLIHFGLCNGTRSSPTVRFFSAQGIEAELRFAAREFFLENGIEVDLEKRTVNLTRIIKWYSIDFGQEKEILKWLLIYLDATKAGLLTHLLSDGGPVSIVYQNYDWSLNS
ncbi:hypothetical protein ACLOJK_017228 [Asimina triloba]